MAEEESPEVVEALVRDQLARLGWLHVDHGQASGEAVLEELLVRESEVRGDHEITEEG